VKWEAEESVAPRRFPPPHAAANLKEDRTRMSELSQFIIVAAFGGLCFGCGYLIAFIVTRNKWRDEMIKRGVARYNWQTGKWEWGEPPKDGQSRY
jgi:hypothetical protein